MDVINVLDVMNVKDVTDIMDIPNEINGLNARAWVPVFVLVIVFIFVFSRTREIELVLGGFPCQGFRAFPHARARYSFILVFVFVIVFVLYCIMQEVTVRAPTIVVMRVQMALMITRQFSL